MLKRLILLFILAVATVSVGTPAHATALTVTLNCGTFDLPIDGFGIDCTAYASGGMSPYAFRWYRNSTLRKEETSTTGYSSYAIPCRRGTTQTLLVVVTDSTGAQASATLTEYCS